MSSCYIDLLQVLYIYEPNSPFDFSTVRSSTPLFLLIYKFSDEQLITNFLLRKPLLKSQQIL